MQAEITRTHPDAYIRVHARPTAVFLGIVAPGEEVGCKLTATEALDLATQLVTAADTLHGGAEGPANAFEAGRQQADGRWMDALGEALVGQGVELRPEVVAAFIKDLLHRSR